METKVTTKDLFFTMPDGREICSEDDCIVFLITNDICILGTERTCFFEDPEGRHTCVYVLCSDTFDWGCADAEPLPHAEIGPLTKLYLEHGYNGVVKWVALRRGTRPLDEVVTRMKAEGFWTDELEALPK